MKIILTEKIEGLGQVGDICDVKPGYARNFLLSKKKAILLSDPLSQEIIKQKHDEKEKDKIKNDEIDNLIKSIDGKKFTITSKSDKSGNLYGSIGPKEISKVTKIPEKYLKNHFKKLGIHEIDVVIANQKAQIKIEIVKEK